MGKVFKLCSWNVCGLNDPDKCTRVLNELLKQSPDFVLLQETKLSSINNQKLYSFLPRSLDSHQHVPSIGASGGILTAWSSSSFSCRSFSQRKHLLTVTLHLFT